MATITDFHPGGFQPVAPANNKAEQWTNATQPGDPTPAGYTAWDTNGNITAQRALTVAETNQLAEADTAHTAVANQSTTAQQLQTDLNTLRTWLANNPNGAVLTAAQTRVLARMLANVVLYCLEDFANSPTTT